MARLPTGIRVRHGRRCRSREGAACNCRPSFEAWVFDHRAVVHERGCPAREGAKCNCQPSRGGKVRRTFPTLAAAKAWRADASTGVRQGSLRPAVTLTLEQAAEQWLAQTERGEVLSRHRRPYKPSVVRSYAADLRRYVLPDLGAAKLADLTADDFQALVDRLVGSGLSGSKVRNILVPCQALYRRHRRQVLADPTDGLDLPEPGGRRERVITPAQAEALLGALPDKRALWAMALYAGLRRGELRALRVVDVDLEGGSIAVERGWDDYAGPIDPKSKAGVRTVPLSDTLRVILDEHIARNGRQGDELVFGRLPHSPFTPSHVQDSADEAWAATVVGEFFRGESAGLERVTLHECRHSFSTYLDAAGITETRADRYMGHSNPSVANRYRHQLEGQLAEDAARLDAYLTGAVTGKVVQLPTGAHSGAPEAQTRLAAQSG